MSQRIVNEKHKQKRASGWRRLRLEDTASGSRRTLLIFSMTSPSFPPFLYLEYFTHTYYYATQQLYQWRVSIAFQIERYLISQQVRYRTQTTRISVMKEAFSKAPKRNNKIGV